MKTIIASLLFLAACLPLRAELLVRWNLDNALDDATTSPAVDQNAIANFTRTGLTGFDVSTLAAGAFGFGHDDAITPNEDVNTPSGAVGTKASEDGHTWWARGTSLPLDVNTATGPFLSLSVSSQVGDFDFTGGGLRMRYAEHDRNQAGSYFADVDWFLDEQGSLTQLGTMNLGTVNDNNRDYDYQTVNLDLGAIPATNGVTLRLYFTDNSGLEFKNLILDTFELHGATVIPEPSGLALFGLGALLLGLRRRRAR